jgi:hypothetical protein
MAKDIAALAKEYFEAEKAVKKAEYAKEELKKELCQALALNAGSLTKEQYEVFQGEQKELPGILKASLYKSSRTSADWDYLAEVLAPNQIKRARVISYFSSIRLTPGFDV